MVRSPLAPSLEFTPVEPALATSRRLASILGLFPLVVAAAIASVLVPAGWVWIPQLALVVLVVFAIWQQWRLGRWVRNHGYTLTEHELLVCTGLMFRSIDVVPFGRIQTMDLDAGPIDRRYHLTTLTVHTASAGNDAAISGLSRDAAVELRARLAALNSEQMEGV